MLKRNKRCKIRKSKWFRMLLKLEQLRRLKLIRGLRELSPGNVLASWDPVNKALTMELVKD
jgi:hypothetical protein